MRRCRSVCNLQETEACVWLHTELLEVCRDSTNAIRRKREDSRVGVAVQVWRLVWNLVSYGDVYNNVQFQRTPLVTDAKRQIKWAAEYLQRIHYNGTNLIAMVRPGRSVSHLQPL